MYFQMSHTQNEAPTQTQILLVLIHVLVELFGEHLIDTDCFPDTVKGPQDRKLLPQRIMLGIDQLSNCTEKTAQEQNVVITVRQADGQYYIFVLFCFLVFYFPPMFQKAFSRVCSLSRAGSERAVTILGDMSVYTAWTPPWPLLSSIEIPWNSAELRAYLGHLASYENPNSFSFKNVSVSKCYSLVHSSHFVPEGFFFLGLACLEHLLITSRQKAALLRSLEGKSWWPRFLSFTLRDTRDIWGWVILVVGLSWAL